MVSRFDVLAVDCADAQRLAEFWCAVLGYVVVEDDEEGVSIGEPSRIGAEGPPPGSPPPAIDFLFVPEGKTIKNRLHIDLRAVGTTQEEELARLLGLGARRVDVGQDDDVTWVVLADPEGNEFCLLRTSVPPAVAPQGR